MSGEPVAVLIDGQHFDADITETPEGRHDGGVVLPEPVGRCPSHSHSPGRVSVGGSAEYRHRPLQGLLGEPEWFDLPLNHPTVRANVEDAVFDPATVPHMTF